jgi:hypothetical protein
MKMVGTNCDTLLFVPTITSSLLPAFDQDHKLGSVEGDYEEADILRAR